MILWMCDISFSVSLILLSYLLIIFRLRQLYDALLAHAICYSSCSDYSWKNSIDRFNIIYIMAIYFNI